MYYLKKFINWYNQNIETEFKGLNKEIIGIYIDYLNLRLNKNTVNSCLEFLKSYNKFLIEHGIQQNMVIDSSMNHKVTKISNTNKYENIDEKYINKILQNVCLNDGIKNYTMLYLIANTGLRVNELIDLKLENIDFVKRIIHVTGPYSRVVPMSSNVDTCLKFYLGEISDKQEYLFINERGTQYTSGGVRWILRKNCPDTNITLIILRNSYRTKLKVQGYSEKEIDKLMGYSIKYKSYGKIDLKKSNLKKTLSTGEFAKLFNVTVRTVIKWCDKGIIKAYKTDKGFRRISECEIQKLKSIRTGKRLVNQKSTFSKSL